MRISSGEQARDRVAHFHLSNGARVERLNWAADLSRKGIEQSAGIMVNYLYKLSDIESRVPLMAAAAEALTSIPVLSRENEDGSADPYLEAARGNAAAEGLLSRDELISIYEHFAGKET